MSKKEDLEQLEKILGTPWICIVQLLMLNAKHQDTCIFLPFEIDPTSVHLKQHSLSYTTLTWNAGLNSLQPPTMLSLKKLVDLLKECSANNEGRYIVIPLVLEHEDTDQSGHLNVLIYDKIEKSAERYEPNGMNTPTGYNTSLMDEKIIKFLSYIFLDNKEQIAYHKPQSFCPLKGLQYLEHMSRSGLSHLPFVMKRGTCSLWSIIYADERLSNPTLNRTQIHDKILLNIKNNDTNMYDFIISYLKNVYKVSKLLKTSTTTDEIIDHLIHNK